MGNLIRLSQSHPKTHKANTGNLGGHWQSLREPLPQVSRSWNSPKALEFSLKAIPFPLCLLCPDLSLARQADGVRLQRPQPQSSQPVEKGRETQSGGVGGEGGQMKYSWKGLLEEEWALNWLEFRKQERGLSLQASGCKMTVWALQGWHSGSPHQEEAPPCEGGGFEGGPREPEQEPGDQVQDVPGHAGVW